ncbi:hypothetical protein BLA17378_01965 [Burkholderia aenigmatica]|uniref:Uncharacterized protein n=1 Tax=Burkholderia aenigmatica TaxID=2015348 RepID=A0ABY6XN68_9BURK|nr:hypothetical protein BLA17378_01965 [Burkholderia aenigmatica]
MNELSDYDRKNPIVLDTVGGYATSDVADRVAGVRRQPTNALCCRSLLVA